jgi:hypothetical protein
MATLFVTPNPRLLGRSAYTVLGFLGYGVANIVALVLAERWHLPVSERLIAFLVPPVAFLLIATLAKAVTGRELIVFYQTAGGAVVTAVLVGLAVRADVGRVLDVITIGIAVFLVFGRIGCFRVACCYGRPAAHGVIYGDEHLALGLWTHRAHRRLVPVQLFESVGTVGLIIVALATGHHSGEYALVLATGYAGLRFCLELLRGDPSRPMLGGASEAQWCSLATAMVCAACAQAPLTIGIAATLMAATGILVGLRTKRDLFTAHHVQELDAISKRLLHAPAGTRLTTSRAVQISYSVLPDGRSDWLLSSESRAWTPDVASGLAHELFPEAQLILGRTAGLLHVIVPARTIVPQTRSAPSST